MCGICYRLLWAAGNPEAEWAVGAVVARGPSSFSAHVNAGAAVQDFVGLASRTSAAVLACEGAKGLPCMCVAGAVLHLRGTTSEVNRQPYSAAPLGTARSLLLWNGEVFGGSEVIPQGRSDTSVVFERMLALEEAAMARLPATTNDAIWDAFAASVAAYLESGAILGPYAFVYVPRGLASALGRTMSCVFGRDPMGRRSLVVTRLQDETVIASVGFGGVPLVVEGAPDDGGGDEDGFPMGGAVEVPTSGVCSLVASDDGALACRFTVHRWAIDNRTHPLLLPPSATQTWRTLVAATPPDAAQLSRRVIQWVLSRVGYMHNPGRDCPMPHALTYLYALGEAVQRRVDGSTRSIDMRDGDASPVMVLFSGGVDCTVLAALTHYLLPLTTPIELPNVAFGGGGAGGPPSLSSAHLTSKGESEFHTAPDRLSGYLSFAELASLPAVPDWVRSGLGEKRGREAVTETTRSGRDWRFVEVDVTPDKLAARQEHIMRLVAPRNTVMDHNIGSALWFAAQGEGSVVGPQPVLDALAALGDGYGGTAVRLGGSTPTAGASIEHLGDAFQALVDVLVEEGVGEGGVPKMVLLATLGKEYGDQLAPAWKGGPYRKLGHFIDAAALAGRIRVGRVNGHATGKGVQLVQPEDVARAQAVTARREAYLKGMGGGLPYLCTSRVVLLGMGADETLGGYVRHQRAVSRGGMEGLRTELQRDFGRLWERNLGRDDRVVADSGREGRFPFLDEGVLGVLSSPDLLPLSSVCEFELAAGSEGANSPSSAAVGPGVGDKKVIRTVARMLGLRGVSSLQKRAIQFGTRIADRKMQGSTKLSELE